MAIVEALTVDETNFEVLLFKLSLVDDKASDDEEQSLRGAII
jgi:hypothetical protein